MMGTPFETASMPVYVPPPSEYARTKSLSVPSMPRPATVLRMLALTSALTAGISSSACRGWPTSRIACVTTKVMKIGMSAVTDSLTPRMFMVR